MNKTLVITAATALALSGTAAYAYTLPDSITVTGKATPGGKPSKPKVVGASFANTATGPGGGRATTPNDLHWKWTGIHFKAAGVPTCTSDQIDAAQSDAGCPKKSLVATGSLTALLGPSGNATSNISCEKELNIYNAGAGKQVLFTHGDPAKCAGLAYFPPSALTITKSKSGDTVDFTVAQNIQHPLPGLDGGITKLSMSYTKIRAKQGKKTSGYLVSTGCGKAQQRKVTFTTGYSDPNIDKSVVSSSAGTC